MLVVEIYAPNKDREQSHDRNHREECGDPARHGCASSNGYAFRIAAHESDRSP